MRGCECAGVRSSGLCRNERLRDVGIRGWEGWGGMKQGVLQEFGDPHLSTGDHSVDRENFPQPLIVNRVVQVLHIEVHTLKEGILLSAPSPRASDCRKCCQCLACSQGMYRAQLHAAAPSACLQVLQVTQLLRPTIASLPFHTGGPWKEGSDLRRLRLSRGRPPGGPICFTHRVQESCHSTTCQLDISSYMMHDTTLSPQP